MFTLEKISYESYYEEKCSKELPLNENYSIIDLINDSDFKLENCVVKVNDVVIENDSFDNNINQSDIIQLYILPVDHMFILPTLRLFQDRQEHRRSEIIEKNAEIFKFPQEILEKTTGQGDKISHAEKSGWAITHLTNARMLERISRGTYKITDRGLNFLEDNPDIHNRHNQLNDYICVDFNEKYKDSRNLIYFGAPGTGKSYALEKDRKELLTEEYESNYERVTFHPDYSYANFVGTYKPVKDGKSISYDYVPGPFMRLLVNAYNHPHEPFVLIIEEINRANVSAVFGDVFQLLDRNENNVSRYPIQTSNEMRKYLERELEEKGFVEDYTFMKIPSNMFIWATMNSADQGVFPMDTAFKRRWDFRYFRVYPKDKNKINDLEIMVDESWNVKENKIQWNELRDAINDELLEYVNEDKLLGPYFAFNEYDGEVPFDDFKEIFKNKIIMYLFEDAARLKRDTLFKGVDGKIIYSEICDEFDEKGIKIFPKKISDKFIEDNDE